MGGKKKNKYTSKSNSYYSISYGLRRVNKYQGNVGHSRRKIGKEIEGKQNNKPICIAGKGSHRYLNIHTHTQKNVCNKEFI